MAGILRRHFLLALPLLSGTACASTGYTTFLEPNWFRVDRHEVKITDTPLASPIKIVHLADFHAREDFPMRIIDKAIRIAVEQKPDLICLTGDYANWSGPEPDEYKKIFRQLGDAAPTYACLGNHDGGRKSGRKGTDKMSKVVSRLREAGAVCLLNEAKTVEVRGQKLRLVGLGDLWMGEFFPKDELFAREAPEIPTVVLCHNPDGKDLLKSFDWDLMLSGHTHGGQVQIPLFGPPVLPVNDARYIEGLHRWSGRWLYITRGVGSVYGVRFNCRPEVSVLELK